MWSALRGRVLSSSSSSVINHRWRSLPYSSPSIFTRHFSSSAIGDSNSNQSSKDILSLAEVEKVLKEVGADDVMVFAAPERCEFTDHMVVATGRSPWHVRNICQALIYKAKQKQRGAKRKLLPSVEGQDGGKWIVIDSGNLIVHAVDEKARAYYNFEGLWTGNTSSMDDKMDLQKAFAKVRRKNNSKRRPQPRE